MFSAGPLDKRGIAGILVFSMSLAVAEIPHAEIRPGWWLSADRALYLEMERTLVVADIHWGYAHSHRVAGNLLPLWGNEEIAQRLRRLLHRYRPARMIWLGDSLHTREAADFAERFLAELGELEVIVVRGNHDRAWIRADRAEYRLGRCLFHHGDRPCELAPDEIEIIGHIHPAVSWSDGAGLRLKVPALVQGPRRIILPSFSDWSAGAAWNDRLGEEETLWLVSSRKVWSLPRR
jgi:putative SbcD/Mre11-related phosphoesterase